MKFLNEWHSLLHITLVMLDYTLTPECTQRNYVHSLVRIIWPGHWLVNATTTPITESEKFVLIE